MDIQEFKKSHGYEVGDAWYPRVTRIVEIKAKPALYRFYAGLPNFMAGERIKEKSAEEGTLVHDTIEGLLLGRDPSIPPSIEASVKAFLEFLESKKITVNPDYVEHRLANHDERYAGTLDAIAEIGGKTGIMDIKTSQGIYRDYNLQTAAYMAAMQGEVKNLETRWILRIDQIQTCASCGAKLRKKGGRSKIRTRNGNAFGHICEHDWGPMTGVIELKEFPDWTQDYHAFLGAKRLWEWEHEEMLKKAGYL